MIRMEDSIDALELSVRVTNCLKSDNIYFVGELVSKHEWDLYRIPNLGKRSAEEIRQRLGELGLSLGTTLDKATSLSFVFPKLAQEMKSACEEVAKLAEQNRILRNALVLIVSATDEGTRTDLARTALEKAKP